MGKGMKFIRIAILLVGILFTSCQSIFNMSEESGYKEVADFGRQVKQKYNLQLVGFGGGYPNGIRSFNLTFLGYQNPTLDEARILFYRLAKGFLEKVNANKIVSPKYSRNFPN